MRSVQYTVVAPTRKHYSPPKDPPRSACYTFHRIWLVICISAINITQTVGKR